MSRSERIVALDTVVSILPVIVAEAPAQNARLPSRLKRVLRRAGRGGRTISRRCDDSQNLGFWASGVF